MYRYDTPVIVEDTISISIADINRLFNLKKVGLRGQSINIECKNVVTGMQEIIASLYITVNIAWGNDDNWIELEYECNNEPVKDRINLISVQSNLRKQSVHYYYECLVTGKRCRKLFLSDGHFVSKTAIGNILYQQQIESKKQRKELNLIRKHHKYKRIIAQRFKPYYKEVYGGIRTVKEKKVEKAVLELKHIRNALIKTF